MALSPTRKKQLRTLGHKLKPVVMIADKGLTDAVGAELERALNDHELIKVKINVNDPAARRAIAGELCEQSGAELVQSIGKIILILREASEPNARLSNLLR